MIITDEPKTKPEEDRLNRAQFASRIANTITKHTFEGNFVQVINGPWGSGKTTVANLIEYNIETYNITSPNSEQIEVIRVNVWMHGNDGLLISELLKAIKERVLLRMQPFPRLMAKTEKFINKVPLLPKWLRSSIMTCLQYVLRKINWVNSSARKKLAACFSSVIKHTLNYYSQTASSIYDDVVKNYLDANSRGESHLEIVKMLKKAKVKILVIIDDLDRVDEKSVINLMSSLKTVCSLPFVSYLMCMDKRLLPKALPSGKINKKHEYIAKIIQRTVELPYPEKALMADMFMGACFEDGGNHVDNVRWDHFLKNGFSKWIITPRDVKIYANSFLQKKSEIPLPIDDIDVLFLEGISLYEPKLYQFIKENYVFLLDDVEVSAETGNGIFKDLKSLIEKSKNDRIDVVLASVFPKNRDLFLKESVWIPHNEEVDGKRPRFRIKQEKGFRAFMSLELPEGIIGKEQLSQFISAASDKKKLSSLLARWTASAGSNQYNMLVSHVAQILEDIGEEKFQFRDNVISCMFDYFEMALGDNDLIGKGVNHSKSRILAAFLRIIFDNFAHPNYGGNGPILDIMRDEGRIDIASALYIGYRKLYLNKYFTHEAPFYRNVAETYGGDFMSLRNCLIELIDLNSNNIRQPIVVAFVYADINGIDDARAWLNEQASRNQGMLVAIIQSICCDTGMPRLDFATTQASHKSGLRSHIPDFVDIESLRNLCISAFNRGVVSPQHLAIFNHFCSQEIIDVAESDSNDENVEFDRTEEFERLDNLERNLGAD